VALVLVPGVVYLDLCTLFYLNEITRSSPALFEKKINVEIHSDVSFEFVRFLLIVIIISVFSSKIIISVSFVFHATFYHLRDISGVNFFILNNEHGSSLYNSFTL